MSTLMDDRISMKKETVYGTAITTDRFYPMLQESVGEYDPRVQQAKGLHGGAGRHVPIAARCIVAEGQGTVTVVAELESKAGGVLIEAGVGSTTVTAVTGVPGGSQQVSTTDITGVLLPSYTIQLVTVQNDGTEYVRTFSGCTARKTKISQPEDDFLTIEVEFDALTMVTNVAAASVTYATGPTLFHASQMTYGFASSGLTVPTTTALATGLTANTEFREWDLEIDHGIDDKNWRGGPTRKQPTAGNPSIKFSGKANFDSATIAAGFNIGTQWSFYATATTTEALTAAPRYTALQVVIPKMIISKLPIKPKPGDTRVLDISADVKWDLTNKDVYVVYATTDVAL